MTHKQKLKTAWHILHKEEQNRKCREYYYAHRDELRLKRKAHYEANKNSPEFKLKARQWAIRYRFGLELDEYNNLLIKQGGHCALCDRRPEDERLGKLCIDHEHGTGEVRGLLCEKHNKAIGWVGDTAEGVRKVLAYVERFERF